MKLIDNWKQALKMHSVQAMTVAITVQGVWISLPDDWRAAVPAFIVSTITIICLVLGTIGRLIQQDKLAEPAVTKQDGVVPSNDSNK